MVQLIGTEQENNPYGGRLQGSLLIPRNKIKVQSSPEKMGTGGHPVVDSRATYVIKMVWLFV
jgi:hypothetical protein